MTTAYTSLLGLALPTTGELQGTWGDTVNNSITSLLDTAVAGTTTLSTDTDVTLTTTTGASNQARQAILLCSGARTAARNITAPAQSKIYTVINATTGGYAVVIRGAGPTTGVTIPAGQTAQVAWNGSDFVDASNYVGGNLKVNGNLSVTGTTTLTGAATLTANPTLSAGTANGVAYLNGSKVLTSGSALSFDGTNLTMTGAILAGSTAQTIAMFAGTSASNGNPRFEANGTTASVDASTAFVRANTIVFSPNDASTKYGTINTAGNLFLGNGAPQSDWTTTNGIKVIQVGAGAFTSVSSLNDVNICSNVYPNTSNVYKYLNTTQATIYRQVNGEHWWLTAPSGTAGTTATMLQAMTLTNSGNLGVNATSPISMGAGYTSITTSNTTGGGVVFASNGVQQGAIFNGSQNIYLDTSTSSGNIYFRNTALGSTTAVSPYGIWGFGGATPNTWYTGFAGIDISAAGAISGSNGGVILWGNLYINGSAQLIRKTTGYTTRYVSAADIGEHLFYTGPYAASGGGTVTETNVARIDSSGNLTIAGSIAAGGQFNSNATITISALNTGYAIGNGPWAGAMTARDNTYGGSGLWVQDPNGNGGVAVLTGSSWVNGAYTVYYSGGYTYIKKTSGSVPVVIAYSILYV